MKHNKHTTSVTSTHSTQNSAKTGSKDFNVKHPRDTRGRFVSCKKNGT
jgi:hypothetical protein